MKITRPRGRPLTNKAGAKKSICLRLDPELHAMLVKYGNDNGNMSAVVEAALLIYFNMEK